MNVTVSVFGRFHGFYLAQQLQKKKALKKLITTYPKFEVQKDGIKKENITSLLRYELISRSFNKLPNVLKKDRDISVWISQKYDEAVKKNIPLDTDIFVGWSGKSEQSIKKAKEQGAITIIERGSSHIEYQRDIVKDEYERHGFKPVLPHPEIVKKEKREYELADYISIPSEFVRRTFIEKGFDSEKLLKIPYGVDLSIFDYQPKTKDKFRVVYAGSMTLQKGVHYLLEAFCELNLENAELMLMGAYLPEIAPFFKKYEDKFNYLGHVSQQELNKIYSESSVFVLSSIQEGMAMVQAQAMAAGLPLICTTNTGGEDLIEDGKQGFIIPIRDIEKLKEKILWCYNHRKRCDEMGKEAHNKIKTGHTWDDYGDNLIGTYREILKK